MIGVVWIVVWLATQIMHFSHGYYMGVLKQRDDAEMARRCEDHFLRRHMRDKCTQALVEQHMWPAWSGVANVRDHLSVCGFTTCDVLVRSLGYYVVFAAVALVVVYVGASYARVLPVGGGGGGGGRVRMPRFLEDDDTPFVEFAPYGATLRRRSLPMLAEA